MGMFRALIGGLFANKSQTFVNTVNCVGVMGKGVALEFKKRWPTMFEDYQRRCAAKRVRLGEPYLHRDVSGVAIVNFPTKDHWRSASRVAEIERGLDHLVAHATACGIRSLALPPLGCGNGGLEWAEIGPLIHRKLHDASFDVEVYAPFGTPAHQLTEAFLSAPADRAQAARPSRHVRHAAGPVSMKLDRIAAWAAAGGSETVEFKKSTAEKDRACRTLCAIANGRGGRVLFGVTPAGKAVGQVVNDLTPEELAQEFQGFDPPVFPSIERVPIDAGREALGLSEDELAFYDALSACTARWDMSRSADERREA